MCIMNFDSRCERRFSQASTVDPHTSLLSNLPSSSSLTPRPSNMVDYPSVLNTSSRANLVAPPHQIAPPAALLNGDAPDPEVYAKAYEMLRQRWAGREEELLSMEAVKQHQKRRLEESASSSLLKLATRRSSMIAREHQESNKAEPKQEEEEEEVKPLKRSKSNHDNLISFFDNPPPSSPSLDDDGFLRPSLPLPRRSRSLSPRIPSSSSMASRSTSPSRSPRSYPLNPRKRSISQPCDTRRLSRSLPQQQRHFEPAATPSPSFPFSQSAPQLSHLASSTSPSSSRSEALLHVVKSFEAVLACRAEGWRRLASRKSSATSFTNPLAFPPTTSSSTL